MNSLHHRNHLIPYTERNSIQIHRWLGTRKPSKRYSHCFRLTTSTSGPAININIQVLPSIYRWKHQLNDVHHVIHICAMNWGGWRTRPWLFLEKVLVFISRAISSIHQYSACYHYFCDLDDSDDLSAVMTIVWERGSVPSWKVAILTIIPKINGLSTTSHDGWTTTPNNWSLWAEHFVGFHCQNIEQICLYIIQDDIIFQMSVLL